MNVVELQEKIDGLKNYISGLEKIIYNAKKVITTTEIQLMRTCKHEQGMQYVVGTENSYDPDDGHGSERYHCDYCGVCNVLFVIEKFSYYDKPRQSDHKTVGLSTLMSPYFVDRISLRKDK